MLEFGISLTLSSNRANTVQVCLSLSTLLLLHLIFFVCLFVGLSLFSVFVCGFEMQITCLMKCLAEDNYLFVCVELKCRKSDLGHKL